MKNKDKITENYTLTELNEIKRVFRNQGPSGEEREVHQFVVKELIKMKGVNFNTDKKGNLLITKGTPKKDHFYPCLVAHMDQVFPYYTNYKVSLGEVEKTKEICILGEARIQGKWTRVGGVGDDLGGVWVALNILKKVKVLKVVLTVSEEIGVLGAKELDLNFFKDCAFLLEGDRKNGGDIISSQMCSEEFLTYLEEVGKDYGYKKAWGSTTDVKILSELGVGLACANLSVGYYNPHTKDEITVISELVNARDYILFIVEEPQEKQYLHEYKQYSYTPTVYSSNRYPSYYDDSWDEYDNYYNKWNKVNRCKDHALDRQDAVIDADCYTCNFIIPGASATWCSDCYIEMQNRKFSYYCTECQTHKIKIK